MQLTARCPTCNETMEPRFTRRLALLLIVLPLVLVASVVATPLAVTALIVLSMSTTLYVVPALPLLIPLVVVGLPISTLWLSWRLITARRPRCPRCPP
jgi:hypothetical protein